MAEDLQSLLEKIERDGVEKAEAQAAAIRAKAEADAKSLVENAKAEAAAARAKAEADAKTYAARADETIRQAARDVLLEVEKGLVARLEKLLAKNVDSALSDPAAAAQLALDAVRQCGAGEAEVAANSKLAAALKAQLAAEGKFSVTVDDALETGFSVRLDGGRVEHDFSAKAIAGELAKRLRPDLAALVRG